MVGMVLKLRWIIFSLTIAYTTDHTTIQVMDTQALAMTRMETRGLLVEGVDHQPVVVEGVDWSTARRPI